MKIAYIGTFFKTLKRAKLDKKAGVILKTKGGYIVINAKRR